MTAEEARKISDNTLLKNDEFKSIIRQIEMEAARGKYEITIYFEINEKTLSDLVSRGFKVTKMPFGKTEGPITHIKW